MVSSELVPCCMGGWVEEYCGWGMVGGGRWRRGAGGVEDGSYVFVTCIYVSI